MRLGAAGAAGASVAVTVEDDEGVDEPTTEPLYVCRPAVPELDRLELVGRLESEHLPEKREDRGGHALEDLLAPEAVALALERQVGVGDPRPVERVVQLLRLRRRHDAVVEALEREQRRADPVGVATGERSR